MTTFKNAPDALYRPRRFYKDVAVENGTITLDGKTVKTPGGQTVSVPPAVAGLLAAEWQAQAEWIDPAHMPLTRIVNSALDRDAEESPIIRAEVLRYLETDLTLYRADQPGDLVMRQSTLWDGPLQRFNQAFASQLTPTTGLDVTPANDGLKQRVTAWVEGLDPVRRAALGRLTGLLGSTVLAWNVLAGELDGAGAFAAARADNDHQTERWGMDAEEAKAAETLKTEILSICALVTSL